MKHSEDITEISTALALAQSQMKSAIKESINPHFKSHYADLASVIDCVRGPLTQNGIAFLQFPSGHMLTTLLTHKSGQWIMEEGTPILPRDNSPMAYGAALTYARRQALQTVCGVPAEDDDTGLPKNTPVPVRQERPSIAPNTANKPKGGSMLGSMNTFETIQTPPLNQVSARNTTLQPRVQESPKGVSAPQGVNYSGGAN